MFVRFRQSKSKSRLYVSIVRARRLNGTVRQEHVASLGAVGVDPFVRPAEYFGGNIRFRVVTTGQSFETQQEAEACAKVRSIRERKWVWESLHDHLGRLGLDSDVAAKLMTAVHERVPMPTMEEMGSAELFEAQHDAAFWESMYRTSLKQVESYKGMIAAAQRNLAEEEEQAKREAENAERAKAKIARLGNYG
jgi:hypothetical protein